MSTTKHNIAILILLLLTSSSFGQTLKLTDFRKMYNYDKPAEHKQLVSKGFQLLSDTISVRQKKFKFIKKDTKEIIELTFTEDGEGGEYLNIKYYLTTGLAYKKFSATLPVYKFRYSKRNKRYQLPTSSYSGENIYLRGLIPTKEQKYYCLEYASYADKALSGPRPQVGVENILPPSTDTAYKNQHQRFK